MSVADAQAWNVGDEIAELGHRHSKPKIGSLHKLENGQLTSFR
jgi:hypothetical protein